MFIEVLRNYMSGAAEALAVSGSSSLTTTGAGAEVSSEVVLLICGIVAGWLAWPLFLKALCVPTCGKKIIDETTTVDTEDEDGSCEPSDAEEDEAGLEKSVFVPAVDAKPNPGLALLEQYGVFGAAPGAWIARA